ncbi:MAG: DUF4258 domain-containing protein [candidate division WOR-3 bacterium]
MKIIYTHHAKMRLEIRGITEEMVAKTLSEPDEAGKGYKNRNLVFRTFPQGRIKVVYKVENEEIVIISVMWD